MSIRLAVSSEPLKPVKIPNVPLTTLKDTVTRLFEETQKELSDLRIPSQKLHVMFFSKRTHYFAAAFTDGLAAANRCWDVTFGSLPQPFSKTVRVYLDFYRCCGDGVVMAMGAWKRVYFKVVPDLDAPSASPAPSGSAAAAESAPVGPAAPATARPLNPGPPALDILPSAPSSAPGPEAAAVKK